ncbi:hypothetical protein [Nocardia sp. NPDC051981]|uniref:hypothetical protein n=1 Tax=Nocardia sp. NPDC051981 TaxID=3155417 RepID=UPI00342214D8
MNTLNSAIADVSPTSDRYGQLIFRYLTLAGSVSAVCGSSGRSGAVQREAIGMIAWSLAVSMVA